MEIYCKNCKYFHHGEWGNSCIAPTGKRIKDYIYGDYDEKVNLIPEHKDYPNKKDTNGCTYYKLKWWKEKFRKLKRGKVVR
jgi:hypothetical protein